MYSSSVTYLFARWTFCWSFPRYGSYIHICSLCFVPQAFTLKHRLGSERCPFDGYLNIIGVNYKESRYFVHHKCFFRKKCSKFQNLTNDNFFQKAPTYNDFEFLKYPPTIPIYNVFFDSTYFCTLYPFMEFNCHLLAFTSGQGGEHCRYFWSCTQIENTRALGLYGGTRPKILRLQLLHLDSSSFVFFNQSCLVWTLFL